MSLARNISFSSHIINLASILDRFSWKVHSKMNISVEQRTCHIFAAWKSNDSHSIKRRKGKFFDTVHLGAPSSLCTQGYWLYSAEFWLKKIDRIQVFFLRLKHFSWVQHLFQCSILNLKSSIQLKVKKQSKKILEFIGFYSGVIEWNNWRESDKKYQYLHCTI